MCKCMIPGPRFQMVLLTKHEAFYTMEKKCVHKLKPTTEPELHKGHYAQMFQKLNRMQVFQKTSPQMKGLKCI